MRKRSWYLVTVLLGVWFLVGCSDSTDDTAIGGSSGATTSANNATTSAQGNGGTGGAATTIPKTGAAGQGISDLGGKAGKTTVGTGGKAAGKAGASGKVSKAGAGGAAGKGTAGTTGATTNCGSADNVDQEVGPGPFTAAHIENGGPSGTSWVFYPEEIGRDGCMHPIFNWGPGAGTGPANYLDHLNHLASHGFVIISQPSSGTGDTEKPALEWLIAENEKSGSKFFHKLDTKKVVMGGHSMGALTTMAMADYAPLTLYILVCGGSFGAPTGAENIHAPAIILGGDTDTGTPNFEDDYDVIPTPVIFLIKSGTDHIACARNNLSPWTAFMRWHLYGETKWKADFFGDGKYCKAPWNSCESKGW